ncbi:MAG: DinB family protein [Intrasporangium sp.]|uniref:mycothiol transferase n=1 Tax=Intrasporangium sp. TaxID=1925024 RepID=UPI00264843D0|nr:DinB family protein [Intrasporangium sp.]MDN5796228.1 DinB family protein [Intrasporangium sp.]
MTGSSERTDSAAVALLRDGFDRIHEGVASVLEGLSTDELSWGVDAEANPLGWLVWHLTRQQDGQVAHLSGLESPWKAQWHGRLGLAYKRGASGYGQSAEEVGRFAVEDGQLLVGYHDATHDLTMRWLDAMTDEDWRQVIDPSWDPPVTVAVRALSILEDSEKHLGQAEYLRGLLLRRRGAAS